MYHPQIQVLARAAHWPVAKYGDKFFSVTPAIVRDLREKPYIDQWRTALENDWYHVRLEDHSLLMFSESDHSASFSFLQCPLDVPTFRSYLDSIGLKYTERNRINHRDNYEMVWITSSPREHLTPIRFDYDENGYRCGTHPVSHIHIGLGNQIRIGVNRRMTAVSFVLFVMRQLYPECWERILNHREAARLPKIIRTDCQDLKTDHWRDGDTIELHFS